MIWESTALMTAVDAIVLIAALALAYFVFGRRSQRPPGSGTAGPALIVAGVGLTALFHALDLFAMWVLPAQIGHASAMEWMANLHLNARWGVTLLSMFACRSVCARGPADAEEQSLLILRSWRGPAEREANGAREDR